MSNVFPAGSTSVSKTMTLLMSRQDSELLEIRQLSAYLVFKKKEQQRNREESIYPQVETRLMDFVPLLCSGSQSAVNKSAWKSPGFHLQARKTMPAPHMSSK